MLSMLCAKLFLMLVHELPVRDLDFYMIYAPNKILQNCYPVHMKIPRCTSAILESNVHLHEIFSNRFILGSLNFLCSLSKEKLDKNSARLEIYLEKPLA
jgi:hypothetical protein